MQVKQNYVTLAVDLLWHWQTSAVPSVVRPSSVRYRRHQLMMMKILSVTCVKILNYFNDMTTENTTTLTECV